MRPRPLSAKTFGGEIVVRVMQVTWMLWVALLPIASGCTMRAQHVPGTDAATIHPVTLPYSKDLIVRIASIDGSPMGVLDRDVEVAPGRHELTVNCYGMGYVSFRSASPCTLTFQALPGHRYELRAGFDAGRSSDGKLVIGWHSWLTDSDTGDKMECVFADGMAGSAAVLQ